MTTTTAATGPNTRNDLARQLTVAVSAVLAVIGSFIGSGAAGGQPVQDAAGGALAADATLIAPGTGAFSIWSLIYFGLLAYAVWQFLPAQRTAERHRRLGYPVAASLLLNAAWILEHPVRPVLAQCAHHRGAARRAHRGVPHLPRACRLRNAARHPRDRRHRRPLPRLGHRRHRRERHRRTRRSGVGRLGHPARDLGGHGRGAVAGLVGIALAVWDPRSHRAHAVARLGPRVDRRRTAHGCPALDRRGHHRDRGGGRRSSWSTVAVRVAVELRRRRAVGDRSPA